MPTLFRPFASSPAAWRTALPLLVLALASALSWAIWDVQRRELQRGRQAEVDAHARNLAAQVEQQVLGYEQALRAAHALFVPGRAGREDFRTAVASLRIARHRGLQGLGFAERSPGNEAARVRYFEPAREGDPAAPAAGALADAAHRDALAASRRTGAPTVSRRVRLLQEDARRAPTGHHMYLPSGTGWVFAAFSVDQLAAALSGEHVGLVIRIADADTGSPGLSGAVSGDGWRTGLLTASQRLQAGGHAWTLSVESLPAGAHPAAAGKLQLVAGVGAATSLLLALTTGWLLRRQLRLQRADAALRTAMEQAEAASRAKSQFLAAASHDLRQPVQALGLFTAALQAMGRRAQVTGSEVGHVAGRLQASLQGLGRLLNGLFDLSALESGTATAAPRPVDLGELLADLRETFSGPALAKGLQLRVAAPRGSWVRTDPVVLMRVLSNLVANALRYTQQGRVLVGGRRRPGGWLELQVLDTGIGIAPAEQARIFGEFYQVAGVSRSGERGLGLGLAIAQRSAQLLDTRIEVRSMPGRGSVFSLSMPLAPPPAVRCAPPCGVQHGAGLSGAVLVIDDDPQLIEAMQRLLHEWGHASVAAGGVAEAVAAASRAEAAGGLALVVSDYQLAEGEDGIAAIRAVTERIGRSVPAILLSGNTSPGAAQAAQRHGYPLLHKPVEPAALLAVIQQLAQAASRIEATTATPA